MKVKPVRNLGATLVELLVVMSILAIAAAVGVLNLRPLADPLQDAVTQAEGYLKQVRAKAMATTSAYRVVLGSTGLRAWYAPSCRAANFTEDAALRLDLPEGVRLEARWAQSGQDFAPSDWVCFTSRGLLLGSQSEEPLLEFRDGKGRVKTLRVMLGGGVVRP